MLKSAVYAGLNLVLAVLGNHPFNIAMLQNSPDTVRNAVLLHVRVNRGSLALLGLVIAHDVVIHPGASGQRGRGDKNDSAFSRAGHSRLINQKWRRFVKPAKPQSRGFKFLDVLLIS